MADNDACSDAEIARSARRTKGEARRTKGDLRRSLRAARRARRDASDSTARQREGETLLQRARPLLADAACVATFEPMDTEANITPLNAHLLERARVIVPITLDDLDLAWRDLATGADLGKDAIGTADVVLTPALAIGADGERLGQGGGSYDRALPRRRDGATVIAVVFPDEFAVSFPSEAHDERVDGVLTTEGVTWCRRP